MELVCQAHGLSKQYGHTYALQNLTMQVPKGSIYGLVGRNGAGKTTLIRILCGLQTPTAGSYTLYGTPFRDPAIQQVRRRMGAVVESPAIYQNLSAIHNLKLQAQVLGLPSYQDLPHLLELVGLENPGKKTVRHFSLGMRQRLGIAVALSHHPKLLILDEATSGLDPVVRDEVVEMFSEFTRDEDHAVLISSHIVSDLEKICDYIAFLHKGELMLCEEKDRLLEEYGLIHCSREQLSELDQAAVKGVKTSPYGVEALVCRDGVPADLPVSPVSIEELFIFMVKEAA